MHATSLSAVVLLIFADGASAAKSPPDVQGLTDEYEGDEWHYTERVNRTLPVVADETRMLDNVLKTMERAATPSMAEHVAESLDNLFGPVTTSLARDTDKVATIMANAHEIPPKPADTTTERLKGWLSGLDHPDTVFTLLPVEIGNFGVIDPPAVYTWIGYIDEYMKKAEQKLKTPILSMNKLFSRYLSQVLPTITETANKLYPFDTTERLKAHLMCYWFNSFETPNDVVALLEKFTDKRIDCTLLVKSYEKFFDDVSSPKELKEIIEKFKSKWETDSTAKQPPTDTQGKVQLMIKTSEYGNKVFTALDKYVQEYNSAKPLETLNLLPVLIACFGEAVASSVISAAKAMPQTAAKAKDLETKLIEHWATGKAPEEVFGLLDPGLQAPQFIDVWIKVCDEFVKRRPEHYFDPIVLLKTRYNDNVLASIVVKELQQPHSGSRVQDLLFLNWFDTMTTPENLLTLLDPKNEKNTKFDILVKNYRQFVDNIGPPGVLERVKKWCKTKRNTKDTVKQPTAINRDKFRDRDMFLYDGKVFAAYDSYIHTHNKAKPSAPLRLLAALTTRFGDRDASTMILAAKMHPDTAKVAESLEVEQIQYWVNAGRTPDQVFELLDLDFQSLSSINKWFRFIKQFCHVHQEYLFNPIVTLTKRYAVSELVRLIAEGKSLGDVEQLRDFVIYHLFNSMLSQAKITQQLGNRERKDTITYMKDSLMHLREKMANLPDLAVLQGGHGYDLLETNMRTLLESKDSAHDGLLVDAYDKYVRVYNMQNPTKHLSLLAVLVARFGEREVLAMIESAKSSAVAVETAKLLEGKLVQHLVDLSVHHWADPVETPDVFTKRLLSGPNSELRVFTWVKCIDEFIKRHPDHKFDPIKLLRKHVNDETLATLVVTARLESAKEAERVRDMLVLDWSNKMLNSDQLSKLLNLHNRERRHKFFPVLEAYQKYFSMVDPSSSSSLKVIEDWQKKGLILQAACDLFKAAPTDEKQYGSVINAYDTYVNLYNKMNPTKQLNLLALLMAHFKEKNVVAMIDKAKSFPTTVKVARLLEAEQIQFWVDSEIAPTTIFKLLGSQKSKGLHFIYKWVKFLDIYCKQNTESSFDPIEFLSAHFTDLDLATFLVDATSKNSDGAKRLEAVLFPHWFNKGMTREGLEKLLGPSEATNPTFAPLLNKFKGFVDSWQSLRITPANKTPNYGEKFAKYDEYVRSYNVDKPTEQISLIALLSAVFGDNIVLKMIDEAKKVPATYNSAKLVEAMQVQFWVDAKKTPVEVVELNFGSKSPSLVYKLVGFFDRFCKRYPEASFAPINLLKSRFSDLELAKCSVDAPSTNSDDAKRLETMLFPYWFNKGMTIEGLEELLELKEATTSIFAPLIDRYKEFVDELQKWTKSALPFNLKRKILDYGEVLAKYDEDVRLYNKDKPTAQVRLIALLSAVFGDEIVVKMIDKATLNPATRKVFETQQYEYWVDAKKPLEKVAELLYFDSKGLRFISKWVKFFDIYSKNHPKSSQFPIKALTNYFSYDELITLVIEATPANLDDAKRLEAMLFRDWFNSVMPHDDLFTRLGLNEKKQRIFALELAKYGKYHKSLVATLKPPTSDLDDKILKAGYEFTATSSYIHEFNKKHPTEQLSLFAALTACYGDREASTMIGAAKLVPTTEYTATLLETQQIQYWLGAGRTPNDVLKFLDFNLNDPGMVFKWVKFCGLYSMRDPLFDPIEPLKRHVNELTLVKYVSQRGVQENSDAKQLRDMLVRHYFNTFQTYDKLSTRLKTVDNKTKKYFLTAFERYVKDDDLLSAVKLSQRATEKEEYISIFKDFCDFTSNFNKEHPTMQKSLLALLLYCLQDNTLSMVLEAAKHNEEYKTLAGELQNQRLALWLTDKISPNDVLMLLGLDKIHESFQPPLLTLVKYVDDFNANYPNDMVKLYDVLSKHHKTVAGALGRSTDAKLGVAAERVLKELIKFWRKADTIPEEVFSFLELKSHGANVILRDDFKAWVNYSIYFSFRRPMQAGLSALETLTKTKTDTLNVDSLIATLESFTKERKELEWTSESANPFNLLKSLGLSRESKEGRLICLWGKYVHMIISHDSLERIGWNALTLLRSIYTQKALAKRLIEAKGDTATKYSTAFLLMDLFDFWISKKISAYDLAVFNGSESDDSWVQDLITKFLAIEHVRRSNGDIVSARSSQLNILMTNIML